jgi:hypothetical protein
VYLLTNRNYANRNKVFCRTGGASQACRAS